MALVATDIPIFPQALLDTNGKALRIVMGTLAFDTSYPTDGEAITIANMSEVMGMLISPFSIWNFQYVKSTGKVKAFVSSTGVEVASLADIGTTGTAIPYLAWGRA